MRAPLLVVLVAARAGTASASSCSFDVQALDTACSFMKMAGTCFPPCHNDNGACTPILRDSVSVWGSTVCHLATAGGKTQCVYPCVRDEEEGGDGGLLGLGGGGDGGGGSGGGGGGGGGSGGSGSPPLASSPPPPPGAFAFACRVAPTAPAVFDVYYAQTCPSLTLQQCAPLAPDDDDAAALANYFPTHCCCASSSPLAATSCQRLCTA